MNVFTRFFKGIILRGETTDATDNIEGSVFHNSTSHKIRTYLNGIVDEFTTNAGTQTLTNKTISGTDNNFISFPTPVNPGDPAPKSYIDDHIAGGALPLTGGTMSGNIDMGTNDLLNVDTIGLNGNLSMSSGNIEGAASVSATNINVTNYNGTPSAVSINMVDSAGTGVVSSTAGLLIQTGASDLQLQAFANMQVTAGGIIYHNSQTDLNSHGISSMANPTNPQDAATKSYVDTAVSGGAFNPGAIGASLVPSNDSSFNIGANGKSWEHGYIKELFDAGGNQSANMNGRLLQADDGATNVLDWHSNSLFKVLVPMSMNNQKIEFVSDPTVSTDAATKNYVDTTFSPAATQHQVYLNNPTGHGSPGAAIRNYGTVAINTGTALTYSSNGAGDTITVNTTGLYSMTVSDTTSNPLGLDMGISINASSLTTGIGSLTFANGGRGAFSVPNDGSYGVYSITLWLHSGDVIRAQDSGTATAGGERGFFNVIKVG